MSLVWALLRVLMFLFVDLFLQNAPNLFRLMIWMPEIFQLATFSLLFVFFGLILNSSSKKFYMVFYAVLNGLFVVLHLVVYCLLLAHPFLVPDWVEALSGWNRC